jgi:hypothetical protein
MPDVAFDPLPQEVPSRTRAQRLGRSGPFAGTGPAGVH